MDIGLIGLGKS